MDITQQETWSVIQFRGMNIYGYHLDALPPLQTVPYKTLKSKLSYNEAKKLAEQYNNEVKSK